ncbi:hypothetical protein HDV00_004724 [Rhizophlyctis rosea]|nr:hypothetical protein HDV00_004724 [Rhizophlyctis rosea]
MLPEWRFLFTRQWAFAWILAALFIIFAAVFTIFHKPIFAFLAVFAEALRGMGIWGAILLSLAQFITCIPPIPGYGTLLYLSGFVYGLPNGIVPVYVGALVGGVVVFQLARTWMAGSGWQARIKTHIPSWEAIEQVIDEGGLKLSTLIRLAPYPYNVMTVLFSATSITFSTYTLATALSLLKLGIYVYIGSTIHDIAIGDTKLTPFRVAAMSFGVVVGVGVLAYLTIAVRRVVAQKVADEALLLTPNDVEVGDEEDDAGRGNSNELWAGDLEVDEDVSPTLLTNDFYFPEGRSLQSERGWL